jgi:hypothetical protein
MHYLTTRRTNAPKARFRGKRRYFQKIIQEAESFTLSPQPGDRWDFWHYHADWRGWGNLGFKYRFAHLKALAIVYRRICSVREQFSSPFQVWVQLDAEDAGYDATFLHSINKNREDFPYKILAKEGFELDPAVRELFPDISFRAFYYDASINSVCPKFACVIYSPEVGIPLE